MYEHSNILQDFFIQGTKCAISYILLAIRDIKTENRKKIVAILLENDYFLRQVT
jgi:hypothetical protein